MSKLFELPWICIAIFSVAAIGISPGLAQAQEEQVATLSIGSNAPDLDIQHWYSDNNGLFQHTTKIEENHIYVVEFWATWCKPCIVAMPHIAALQAKYGDQNVQFISVSDEDVDTIEDFLERKVPGDKEKRTFGELTDSFCLTSDPDKSVKEDYFRASQQSGIPCAFIIGKTGLVEWIGSTMRVSGPLELIVEDKWNREEFLVEYQKQQQARNRLTKNRRRMAKSLNQVGELANHGRPDKAAELLQEMIDDEDFTNARRALKTMRMQIMIAANLQGAEISLAEFIEKNKRNAQTLNDVAWRIFLKYESGDDVDEKLLAQAKTTAQYAVNADPDSSHILDTLAHLVYVVDGDLDEAIRIQKDAVKHGGRQADHLRLFLAQLETEKKTGKKAKKKMETSDF